MADHYKILSAGPPGKPLPQTTIYNEESILEKKVFNIKIKEYLIFITGILVATIINSIVRDWLYKMSLDLIMQIQTQGRDPFLLAYFETIKKIGSNYFIYGVLVLIYVFKERALAFHYTLIISAMMFFLCYMKMIIRYPRPY